MLKALVLGKRLNDLRSKLDELNAKDADFSKREAELTEDFNSLTDDSTDEEKTAVTEAMDKFDADKASHEEEKKNLQREISETEEELKALESKEDQAPTEENPAPVVKTENDDNRERYTHMAFRSKAINKMEYAERNALVKSDAIHDFAENIRGLAGRGEKRAVSGTDLLIPDTILPLVHDEIYASSQLLPVVRVVNLKGTGRQDVQGTDPEGIWEGMLEALNELSLGFTTLVEVDGYKVGGYIPIDNAILEDSDINLADTVLSAIGRGIGYALDKAILYGTGSTGKMPTGFAATATATNVGGKTDLAMYKAFVEATGALKHSNGTTFWCMNRATRMKMIAASMSINASGAIVAGTQGTMPVEGGRIIECDFVPDDEIVGGYGQDYLLAQRSGITMKTSEHAMFIQDKTVFLARARYDGKPVFTDGFMVIGLGSTAPTAKIDSNHPFAAAATTSDTTTTTTT